MTRINKGSAMLGNHMTRYSVVDAKMDSPHMPLRGLVQIVREVRTEGRYRPLRDQLKGRTCKS